LAIAAGEIKLELVPQGTLVERMRAGGAGIPAFYTKSGVGTAIAEGKETRVFGDQEYVMEQAMKVDFAFLHAWRGDKAGNLQFRGGSQCFNVSFAKAARVAIAEVEEIVEVGDIPPENVDLPGIFVSRIVELPPEEAAAEVESGIPRRSRDSAREYNGKPALTRQQMAQVAASLLPSTGYVNLGIGLPTLVADYLDANDIVLHAENGILGYGEQVSGADVDQDLYNAGGEFISLRPGASFFESVTSFEMARSGRLAAVLLGAYQVDERGNLANYATPGMIGGGIGGAMDLVVGGSPVIILTEHRGSKGDAKLVRGCTYPLTGKECVNVIVTDLALLRRGADGFVLEAVAPGFTPEEVVGLTEMRVAVPESVGSMAAALEAVG
jgi:3-oxoacid CoA-transferase